MKDRVKEFLDTAEGRKPKEPLDIFVERLMADFAKAEVLREIDLLRAEVNKAQIFTDINEAFINSIKRIESEPKD